MGWQALGRGLAGLTLKSWTPMQANMNCRRVVTRTMFPMVRMATNTHCTTCCGDGSPGWHLPLLAAQPSPGAPRCKPSCLLACQGQKGLTGTELPRRTPILTEQRGRAKPVLSGPNLESGLGSPPLQGSLWAPLTFRPLALLMARSGRSTLRTLRIFTTEMVLDLGAACSASPDPSSLHPHLALPWG